MRLSKLGPKLAWIGLGIGFTIGFLLVVSIFAQLGGAE